MNRELKENFAKIRTAGFFTKGMVYILLGGLTFMAAFDLGGNISSTNDVIQFLLSLPFGKVLVATTALGLLAYALWRLYEMIVLPSGDSDDHVKRGFSRFRFFYSAVFYGLIAYSFIKPLLGELSGKGARNSGGDNNGQEKAALWELLSTDGGKAVIWAIAAIIAGQALWQFRMAYRATFMKKLDNSPKLPHEYLFIKRAGRLGYGARGVVFGVLSFLLIQVILNHNADAYSGTEGALQYLLSFSYGSLLLGTVALGLLGYGIFNVMVARYADYTTLD